MPREFKRSDRVADAIQRSLAQIIQTEMRDPRLGMVNINAVSVTQDLSIAKVYVTFVGQAGEAQSDIESRVDVLNNASSFMRGLVAKDLQIRTTPRLQFIFDKSVVRGQEMTDLINRAISSDRHQGESDSGQGGEAEGEREGET
ncbi:MAG: 30S ribosome-binding factor RbfA [Agarilytica sp.]